MLAASGSGTADGTAPPPDGGRADGGELGTFTCAEEWARTGPLINDLMWLAAFDASAPADPLATCLWIDRAGNWHPASCSATAAGYRERR